MKKLFVLLLSCCMLSAAAAPAWEYPLYIKELHSDINRLVNRDSLLDAKDIPNDLVEIPLKKASTAPLYGRKIAVDALEKLFAAASEENLTLYVKSAYRSYETQNTMYHNRLERNNGKDDQLVAYPGASEHQSGLAFDVVNLEYAKASGMNAGFYNSKEGKWLEANCTRFGFVIRYEKDKEDITKIKYEPWHIRFVGQDIAKYMQEHHLSHEEFTEEWQNYFAEYEALGGSFQTALDFENAAKQPDLEIEELEDGETEISVTFKD
ncbi:MAG: M15 family metallopeptidase [Eubacteriales bacterium]|nr:M15 family metallopeptidase [Eubacteriales bacterium]